MVRRLRTSSGQSIAGEVTSPLTPSAELCFRCSRGDRRRALLHQVGVVLIKKLKLAVMATPKYSFLCNVVAINGRADQLCNAGGHIHMQKNFLTNAVQSGLHPETRLAKLLLITLAHKVPSYPAGFCH